MGFLRTGARRQKAHIRDCDFRSEEHTSELQSLTNLVCRLLLEKKKAKDQIQGTAKPASRVVDRESKPPAANEVDLTGRTQHRRTKHADERDNADGDVDATLEQK